MRPASSARTILATRMNSCPPSTASMNSSDICITWTPWKIRSTPTIQNLLNVVGPRNLVHSWATDVDDPTDMPRWGKIGKQKIEDEGPLPPHPTNGIKYNM